TVDQYVTDHRYAHRRWADRFGQIHHVHGAHFLGGVQLHRLRRAGDPFGPGEGAGAQILQVALEAFVHRTDGAGIVQDDDHVTSGLLQLAPLLGEALGHRLGALLLLGGRVRLIAVSGLPIPALPGVGQCRVHMVGDQYYIGRVGQEAVHHLGVPLFTVAVGLAVVEL